MYFNHKPVALAGQQAQPLSATLQIVGLVMGGGRLDIPVRDRLPGPDTASFAGQAGCLEHWMIADVHAPRDALVSNTALALCCHLQGWTPTPSLCAAAGLRTS
jgi:hypothetical protein